VGFEADDKIRQVAEAYAADAVDLARETFGLTLDWSDDSVRKIEAILDRLHAEMPKAKPTEEQLLQFAKILGSYVGEVFRRNHGATWGMVTLGGDSFPGMRAERTRAEFWPWGKAVNRLRNGPEDNVWHYYCHLRSQDGGAPDQEPEHGSPSPKRPWWRRMLGGA
jgi:hypothetical protein